MLQTRKNLPYTYEAAFGKNNLPFIPFILPPCSVERQLKGVEGEKTGIEKYTGLKKHFLRLLTCLFSYFSQKALYKNRLLVYTIIINEHLTVWSEQLGRDDSKKINLKG